jgi:UDP-N-acetylglucosamine enolpyruvyl transferase
MATLQVQKTVVVQDIFIWLNFLSKGHNMVLYMFYSNQFFYKNVMNKMDASNKIENTKPHCINAEPCAAL